MPSWRDRRMKENVLASETQTEAPAFGRGRSWAQVMERYGLLVVLMLLVVATPLIMTLAMMYIGRGLAFMYSGGLPIYGIRPAFIQFGNGFTAGIPNSVLYFVALLILSIAVLRFTAFGRFVLAVGSNEEAARLT